MPSTIIGNPLASGPQQIVSGNPWSGTYWRPAGCQLVLDRSASGSVYIGFSGGGSGGLGASGGVTLNSGGMLLSGAPEGLMDGVQMAPGAGYFVPARAFDYISGSVQIYARHDAAVSGQARLYFEFL